MRQFNFHIPTLDMAMKRPLNFISITGADFIVRSAYQMGKTPLLPIFAMALGGDRCVSWIYRLCFHPDRHGSQARDWYTF